MKGKNTKRYEEKRNTKEFKPGISYYLNNSIRKSKNSESWENRHMTVLSYVL